MENMNDQSAEVEQGQYSVNGIAIGFALGVFLFWLTIKIIQVVSAL